uniref:Uncharacterized protein n=1 Tax=Setaria digitata TaxID=48799 RepID=A0A915PCM6_9BILA
MPHVFLIGTTVTWKSGGEPKQGPCPEKWFPLMQTGANDYTLLKKCIVHLDVSQFIPKVEKLNDAITACSRVFATEKINTTIYRPTDRRELKSFLSVAKNGAMEGMIDIFAEGKIPYDHFGNDLRELGGAVVDEAANATDKFCAWNNPQKHTLVRI